jgi:hypothetical protein
LDNGTKTRFVQEEFFIGLGVGLFKLMNEALKKEAEAKVTEKLV